MKIDSAIRYTIKQFINDFISEYGLFTHRAMEKYSKRNGNPYGTELYVNNYYLPFNVNYGATKVCLLFNNCEYVFKLPLYNNLEKHEEARITKQAVIKNKNGAYPVFSTEDDYCKIEADNFAEAEVRGLDPYFAAEYKVMNYHGMPIYAQERISITYYDSDRYDEPVDDDYWGEIEYVINNLGATREMCELADNEAFVEDLCEYSGADFEDLLNFIAEFSITDLHDENVGYDKNGCPKLIDYSGFHSRI